MDQTTGEVQGIDGPVLRTRPLGRSFACQCSSKELDEHLDEQFQVSMEVTKRMSDIMEDPEL
jgi:hypothetical protein